LHSVAFHHVHNFYTGRHFYLHISPKQSLTKAERKYYRAANAVFGKIGRSASEEVTLEVIKSKCLPVLLYDLEVYPLTV